MHAPLDPFAHHPLPREPLVRCSCGSGLLYPIGWGLERGSAVVECRCPECGLCDVVVTSPLVAVVWRRREARVADAMHRLAEVLEEQQP